MKKLSKLKLISLSEANLEDKEMNILNGGCSCGCGCLYEGAGGGSSTAVNMVANSQGGLHSSSYSHSCSCGATGSYSNGAFHWTANWYSHSSGGF